MPTVSCVALFKVKDLANIGSVKSMFEESFDAVAKACGAGLVGWEVSSTADGQFIIKDAYTSVTAFCASAAATASIAEKGMALMDMENATMIVSGDAAAIAALRADPAMEMFNSFCKYAEVSGPRVQRAQQA